MKVFYFLVFSFFIFLFSCKKESSNRWETLSKKETSEIVLDWKDVSKLYFDSAVSNDSLKIAYPDFFSVIPDSILTRRRSDSLTQKVYQSTLKKYNNPEKILKKIQPVLNRLNSFKPSESETLKVYSFIGELPYEQPIAYFGKTNELIIGLDWFLGQDYKPYAQNKIPKYLTVNMNEKNFEPKLVESIANQIVPFEVNHTKFIEKMIYEGKKLIVQDALLPHVSDALKIGYTPEQIQWAKENEAYVYTYFTENELFFSDNQKLEPRFLDVAPFSKFYSDDDRNTPGKIGSWMGWQICKAYLDKHPKMSLTEFLALDNHEQIFQDSKYKPLN